MLTVADAVLKSTDYLRKKGIESPRLDAELLLGGILACDRMRLYMEWQKPLTDLEVAAYRDFIKRRGAENEPVARILGKRAFYKRDFEVTPDTFVPRPETEGVVERALMLLAKEPVLQHPRQNIFEVGTGTGCISISIALEADGHHFIATDVSPGALATARKNARKHGVEARIDFRQGSVFAGYEGSLALVVSNPPYIRADEIPTLPPEVRSWDPHAALDGGRDGLDVVRTMAADGVRLLIPGGWMVFELGEAQPHTAADLFRDAGGAYDEFHVEKDLAGLDRYLMVRRSA